MGTGFEIDNDEVKPADGAGISSVDAYKCASHDDSLEMHVDVIKARFQAMNREPSAPTPQ
jgi:hypothetical protein